MSLPDRLQYWLEGIEKKGHSVELTLTRNRRSMISVQRLSPGRTRLRMHESFAEAPESILVDLEHTLLTNDHLAWKRVAAFARTIDVPGEPKRSSPLYTQGSYFDLDAELGFVKSAYFEDPPEATITWGQAGKARRRKRRSIRFGSWVESDKLVRIHPLLDQKWIPQDFIRYIIYHELCHAVAKPLSHGGGHYRIHHPEFKRLEAHYPTLEEMEKLSRKIFSKIIRMRD